MKKEIKAALVAVVALVLIIASFLILKACGMSNSETQDITDTKDILESSETTGVTEAPSTLPSATSSQPLETAPSNPSQPDLSLPSEPVETEPEPSVPLHLEQIEIISVPQKLDYYIGETLQTSGLMLKARYDDGSEMVILSDFSCSPMVLDSPGTQIITVTYGGQCSFFEVSVSVPSITGIAINTLPDQITYHEGEELDPSGLILTASYSDGSQIIVSEGYTILPNRLSSFEMQQICVRYEGFSTSFDIQVILKVIASGICGENLTWQLTDRGTLNIWGNGDMYDYSLSNSAPWNAFKDQITKVSFSKGVTTIGEYAFAGCSSITSVWVQEGNACYLSDEHGTLYSKDKKELILFPRNIVGNLVIPDSVEIIHYFALEGCMLSEIIISDYVTTLNCNAFSNCKYLKSVTIGSGVKEIGANVFTDCPKLRKIVIQSMDCLIFDTENTLGSPDMTILCGYDGSTAQDYAQRYGYEFVKI